MKRSLLTLAFGVAVLCVGQIRPIVANPGGVGSARLDLVEATVDDLQKAIQTGLVTIEQLTEMYLARVAAYDDAGPAVNAFLHVNANARDSGETSSTRSGIPGIARSPLYGIPVLLKDNIDTADMPTTAGSVALDGLDSARRCVHHAQAARGRRDHHRKSDADGVRQLHRPRDADGIQLSRPVRLQSVRSACRCQAATAGRSCKPAARARARASP